MSNKLLYQAVSLSERVVLLQGIPLFSAIPKKHLQELSNFMEEVRFDAGEIIVKEHEVVDAVYFIVKGQAEVNQEIKTRKKLTFVPIALMYPGENIGLNETGFYSKTGIRTANVIAITPMLLLKLDIHILHEISKKNYLASMMNASSLKMMRMQLIKQGLPFSQLSHDRLEWLADRVEEKRFLSGAIIFKQGDLGNVLYLVNSGSIEIYRENEKLEKQQLAILTKPALFGEATLITQTVRNATAKAITDCELLMLRHEYLSELLESDKNVAMMLMSLMINRSRPIQVKNITSHDLLSKDGETFTILKNIKDGNYFKLSKEGAFIWSQLDGEHSLQEITLNLAEKFHLFAPDLVAALISKLNRFGFIDHLELNDNQHKRTGSRWAHLFNKMRRFLEKRVAFGDADHWITRTYHRYIHYFYTLPALLIMTVLIIVGFAAFIETSQQAVNFFSDHRGSVLLLLTLIPFSIVEVILHELAHAYTVKYFSREVHYMGVGWYWLAPIAFTDTSDMWLASRRSRVIVNLAGIYMDVLIAGLSTLAIFLVETPYIQGMLWLFALYTYIGAFRMLSPLQEMDGYYALMDIVERNRLRQLSVIWLVKIFPKSLRHPKLFKSHWPELCYWIACLLFLAGVTYITVLFQSFIFKILGMQVNSYFSLILPFLVLILSSLSIIAEVKHQAEE